MLPLKWIRSILKHRHNRCETIGAIKYLTQLLTIKCVSIFIYSIKILVRHVFCKLTVACWENGSEIFQCVSGICVIVAAKVVCIEVSASMYAYPHECAMSEYIAYIYMHISPQPTLLCRSNSELN